ncbi:MAG: carboxymuconolactone decarboxylase family protein [Candidatus Tectimicrobiota bacterium]
MARTPTVTREHIPEPLQAAFDAETAASGGTIVSGPGSVMIHSPEMRRRANALVNYLRDESSLSKKIQELVMILTARAMDCPYIWHAHAARARQQGISAAFVEALRDRKPLPTLPADEQTVVTYVQELFTTHKTSPATFQAALTQLGARGLTELTTLMGYYTLLAFNANAFEIDVPAGGPEPLLPL